MSKTVNLIFYGDSIALRRLDQNQDWSFTYPYLVQEEIQKNNKVNLLIRNQGAYSSGDVKATVERDSGYFRVHNAPANHISNICVIQVGVVDCAPRPLTYGLYRLMKRIPLVREYVAPVLHASRPSIQKLYSYPAVPLKKFKKNICRIEEVLTFSGFCPIWLTIPSPPDSAEMRSPGFQKQTLIYSAAIRSAVRHYIDTGMEILQSAKSPDEIYTADGHHLTEAGHAVIASSLIKRLNQIL